MFRYCKTQEEAKKLYYRLASHLHPDKGGENDLMILLQESYKSFKTKDCPFDPSEKSDFCGKYQEVYEDVLIHEELVRDLFKEMFLYSKNHPSFNNNYLDSVFNFGAENGYLTSGQYNSLVKIYYSFRMDKLKKNHNK